MKKRGITLTYRQISGDSNAVPKWLIKAALRRRWTLVSANYRTLPESSGFEVAEDLLDAFRYVARSGDGGLSHDLNKPGLVDPSRIIIAGHSGGGYSAVLATIEIVKRISASPEFRKPAATVAVYPMLDFLSPKWSSEGIDLGASREDIEAGRKDLERRLASKEISFGERFPDNEADIIYHGRWDLMRYIVKVPLFVNYLTGISDLGKKLASAASTSPSYEAAKEEIVPPKARHLFVLDFDNLTSDFPPLFVVHGLADTAVPFEDSDKLVEKTKTLGIPTRYWRLEGFDHDFDLGYPDLENADPKVPEMGDIGQKALRELLQGLDGLLGTSKA